MSIKDTLKKWGVSAAFGAGVLAGAGGAILATDEPTQTVMRMEQRDVVRPVKKDLLSVRIADKIVGKDTFPQYRTDTVQIAADRIYPAGEVRDFVKRNESLTITIKHSEVDTAIQYVITPDTTSLYAIVNFQTMFGEEKSTQPRRGNPAHQSNGEPTNGNP